VVLKADPAPMTDVFTPDKRSAVMSRIRGRGNRETELVLARLLHQYGITGWRRHQPLFGRPDFSFRKQRLVVFVDGCFWHGCPRHSNMPENNRAFWEKKLTANIRRDRLVNLTLKRQGWRVVRIWEHDLPKKPKHCIRRIVQAFGWTRVELNSTVSAAVRQANGRRSATRKAGGIVIKTKRRRTASSLLPNSSTPSSSTDVSQKR
jgi:DNA mismatch endonuclease (patch repair protein)